MTELTLLALRRGLGFGGQGRLLLLAVVLVVVVVFAVMQRRRP